MTFDASRPLVFMHVAKSSGTSLHAGLMDTIAPRRALGGQDRVMFGGFDGFDGLSDRARAEVHLDPLAMPDADFVHGHIALSSSLARYPDAQFITVLREPCSRLLSHHRYWRSRTHRMLQGWGGWSERVVRAGQTLEQFLVDPLVACQTDNMTLRMLLWPHALIPDQGFIDPVHDQVLLDAAMARLARFDWADVMENGALAGNLSGWLLRPFRYRHLNAARARHEPGTSLAEELSERAFALLAQRSRLDLALWRHLVRQRLPDVDPDLLQWQAMLRTVARHGSRPRGREIRFGWGEAARAVARRMLELLPTHAVRQA